QGIEVTHDYVTKKGAIPLPATLTMLLGERINEAGSGASVRLFSDFPFPWRTDGGPRDDFERRAIQQLRQNPDQPFFRFEESTGRRMLRYATADLMRPACVHCHNNHPDTPFTEWKTGDVRGVLEVSLPLDIPVARTRGGLQGLVTLLMILGMMGLSGLVIVVRRFQRSSSELSEKVKERTAQLETASGIFENMEDGYFEVDIAGNYTHVNAAAARQLGTTREKMVGTNFSEYVGKSEAKKLFEIFNKMYKTGSPVNQVDYLMVTPDGIEKHIEITATLIHDTKGNPIGSGGVNRDVTERKLAEEAIKNSERYLTQIINFLPEATFMIDTEGRVVFWNRKIEEMVGVKSENILGKGNYEHALPFYGE
ncbi:MAG: PAS domain S-box protein, partial [Desulfobacterales bacterium]|nr:PAS domain S-box protein [Desulfobacterales bacterium]